MTPLLLRIGVTSVEETVGLKPPHPLQIGVQSGEQTSGLRPPHPLNIGVSSVAQVVGFRTPLPLFWGVVTDEEPEEPKRRGNRYEEKIRREDDEVVELIHIFLGALN